VRRCCCSLFGENICGQGDPPPKATREGQHEVFDISWDFRLIENLHVGSTRFGKKVRRRSRRRSFLFANLKLFRVGLSRFSQLLEIRESGWFFPGLDEKRELLFPVPCNKCIRIYDRLPFMQMTVLSAAISPSL
jgi:hypothetical protein